MLHSLLKWFIYSILGCIILIIANYFFINYLASHYIEYEQNLTIHPVGLIFGTSKSNGNGGQNIFFLKRIEQAVKLYQSGKIEYILVSGDNRQANYNEANDMKNALVERGIPVEKIVLDYAGLSTRDSIARAHRIFQANDLLLISQKFQIQRGLVACLRFEIICRGSSSEDVSIGIAPRVYIREFGARIKLRYDFFLSPSPTIGGKVESTPWNS